MVGDLISTIVAPCPRGNADLGVGTRGGHGWNADQDRRKRRSALVRGARCRPGSGQEGNSLGHRGEGKLAAQNSRNSAYLIDPSALELPPQYVVPG